MKTNLKPQINPFNNNPIEALRDAGVDSVKAVGNSIKSDLIQAGGEDFISQLLGIERTKQTKETSGELKEGEELVLVEKEEKRVNIEAHIDYRREIIHAETRINHQENAELRARMDELRIEIAKLAESSGELQAIARDINLDTLPENPGKLHVNFFEWIILQLKAARIKVENSVSWSNAVLGKKGKKDYWNLAKKHGTSFSLSGERAVAQQTG